MSSGNIYLILLLTNYIFTGATSCKPDVDGRFTILELASASNVTAIVGSDVHFICCGGIKWTFEAEDGFTSREIGPHPDAVGALDKRPIENIYLSSPNSKETTSQSSVTTTVYTMHDDKGRLILRIDNADIRDMGNYKCHGQNGAVDAFLVVASSPKIGRNSSLPSTGKMIPHYIMFSSDQLNNVKLHCPLEGSQTVQSWLWREPILPNSSEYAELPEGRPPSRTVTALMPGLHEGKHVEIGPGLAWARIVDPLSPEAPVKLWCQFKMPSSWTDKDHVTAYYEIDWELYEPISPRIFLLPEDKNIDLSKFPSSLLSSSSTMTTTSTLVQNQSNIQTNDLNYYTLSTINAQIEQAIQLNNRNKKPILLENKPVNVVCQFRPIPLSGLTNKNKNLLLPNQQVYWYRNGQSVHIPPFHIDNSFVSSDGLSILSVRAYPASFNQDLSDTDRYNNNNNNAEQKLPLENITCSVTSRVKEKPVYKVTTNASLQAEVILVPRIINTELLSAERSLEDAIKLTCTAIANGPPEMRFDFSPTGRPKSENGITEWKQLEPRYGLNVRPIQVDSKNPTLHRLVIDISDLKRSDHGVYRCTVWNQAGESNAVGRILVHSEPQLELVSFGHNYFLGHKPWKTSCIVKGYPLALSSSYQNFEQTNNLSHDLNNEELIKSTTDNDKPIKLKIFNTDGEPLDRVAVNLIDYKGDDFTGINATYEVHMSQRLGREAIVRCEYTHINNHTIFREIFLREATKPNAPNITVLCTGPRAIVFGITNPKVKADSSPNERIVTQKVIFAPAKTFHLSSSLASLSVYLDSEGQPSASPFKESDLLDNSVRNSKSSQPFTAVIPVKGLMPDTEYVFEWSSGNEFGLSVMIQFTLWTKKIEIPPAIKNVVFLKPTSQYLRFSVFLGDSCPYEGGARPELSDFVVRYRLAQANDSQNTHNLYGVGEWSDIEVCKNLLSQNPSDANNMNNKLDLNEENEHFGLKWAGDSPIPCELQIADSQQNYEVQIATRNRFEKSDWFTTVYRPNDAISSASFCFPPCGSSDQLNSSLQSKILMLIMILIINFVE